MVVSGHTHQAYNCMIDGRLVTSAHRYGTMVTEIDLKLSRGTHDVISAKANNVIVNDSALAKDPAEARLLAAYEKVAAPIESRSRAQRWRRSRGAERRGRVATRRSHCGCATCSVERCRGSDLVHEHRCIRTDLKQGQMTYSDLFTIQPFGNALVTMDLTGAQLKQVLEQQWYGPMRVMPSAKGFSYIWDNTGPTDGKVKSMTLDGMPIDTAATYRVVVSRYLAGGGDGMTVFKSGTNTTPR